MTKQEFMDKAKKSKDEEKVLQLMLGMSKTQLLTTLRHLKMVHKTLYTTEMRSTTLGELTETVLIAHTFMEEGQIDNYGMENKK